MGETGASACGRPRPLQRAEAYLRATRSHSRRLHGYNARPATTRRAPRKNGCRTSYRHGWCTQSLQPLMLLAQSALRSWRSAAICRGCCAGLEANLCPYSKQEHGFQQSRRRPMDLVHLHALCQSQQAPQSCAAALAALKLTELRLALSGPLVRRANAPGAQPPRRARSGARAQAGAASGSAAAAVSVSARSSTRRQGRRSLDSAASSICRMRSLDRPYAALTSPRFIACPSARCRP